MEIKIKIEKRHFFILMFVFVSLVGLVGVIAYGGNQPNILGHTDGEIRLPALNQNLDAWSSAVESRVGTLQSNVGTIQTTYCQQGGTNCPAAPSTSGLVVGGGNSGVYDITNMNCFSTCTPYLGATCSGGQCGGNIVCPALSTSRPTGLGGTPDNQPSSPVRYYICVKN